jgi:hypothetical protein
MKNVLVFPCGSEIGLEIYRSLEFSTHFKPIGGSSIHDHGEYVYKNYVDGIPFVDDELFIDKLNEIIEQREIEFIFPAHDSVVLKLSEAAHEGKLNCQVITSPFETCQIARSKKATYEALDGVVPIPKLYEVTELTVNDFPIFLKPDVGQGSKGTFKAESLEDVMFYVKKDSSLLLVEYLPGKEYTIDCFTDSDGVLRFSEGRERTRISGGISVSSKTNPDPRFHDLAKQINNKLTFNGAWFFQVKENKNNDLVLMEIAPRIAGTMGLIRNKGVNPALLSLFNASGQKIDLFENKYTMIIDRALQNSYKHDISYKHVYVDLDDTLIIDTKVNTQLISFLFQCINKGVKLHLITRHKEVIDNTLAKHRLTNVFDDIIVIEDDASKAGFVKFKDSIFIDDSFAERKSVFDELGIPVFDPHMVESLIE